MPHSAPPPRVMRCRDEREVAERAAAALAIDAQAAAARGGSLSWVAAGGPEAETAFDVLAGDRSGAVPWEHVTVLLGDERCVERGDPDSNWTQLERRLLGGLPSEGPRQVRPRGELGPEAAAEDYGRRLADELGDVPVIDQLWLGVGANGHTLSLFPGRSLDSTDLVVPVRGAPDPPPDRISFTLHALGHVGRCVVLAAGAEKREAVTRALRHDETLPLTQAVHAVLRGGGEVVWLVDEAASGAGA